MTIAAEAEKNVLSRNESVRAGFSINNDSTAELKKVRIKLLEHVYWRAQGRKASRTSTLSEHQLARGELAASRMVHSENETSQGLLRNKNPYTKSAYHYFNMIVSARARDSYEGEIIRVQHEICVIADTPCCISSPQVNMSVYIQPYIPTAYASIVDDTTFEDVVLPSAPPEPEFVIPTAWSPKTADPVDLPMAHAVYGGKEYSNEPNYQTSDALCNDLHILASAPPLESPSTSSVHDLLNEFDRTFDHVGIIEQYMTDEKKSQMIMRMTPTDVGQVIQKVPFPPDKVRVAECLSSIMGECFTVSHLQSILEGAGYGYHRIDLILKLSPKASDFNENREKLYQTLDWFEKKECESVFL
eukprot:CAMPEP_0196807604 /NCGR_PEP_ID=MMETSP1362-20130617/7596_1 /TAXON_ID=163516 /ORGANISM="Leptocylindrus danicus, Strain CCMP1856" /LENGTH=357 /DNA_ID=CAMNT_0042181597 /DNA_START=600 /DNA_END=1673 /DNA_ORIENTATION=+